MVDPIPRTPSGADPVRWPRPRRLGTTPAHWSGLALTVAVWVLAWAWGGTGPGVGHAVAGAATAVPTLGTLEPRTAHSAAAPAATLAVEAADVSLQIYRGGGKRPDGAAVPRKGAWVQGRARYRLSRPAQEGDTLTLLSFADSMPIEPTHLVETALQTYIDGPFDPSALEILSSDGAVDVARVGEHRDVLVHPTPGTRHITLRYSVKVPKRYWPFGCVKKRCSLSGALAPLPSVPALGGRYLPDGGRVVAPLAWKVSAALVGEARATEELLVVGGDGGEVRAYPSVFWGPRWHRVRTYHRGVLITVLHIKTRPSAQVPEERFVQLRRDLPGHAIAVATEVVDLLAHLGSPLAADTEVTFVHGPLRSAVAEFHPDVVVLSDQALEIFPSDRFVKFHLVAIARAVLDMLAQRTFVGTHDPSTDTWLSGMLAFAQTSLWRRARDHRDEFAADILRNLTFVPAVDRFLYTQQAAFAQSYFRGVDDAPELRNHPLSYSHALPTGRRIHEKLRDTIGEDALAALYRQLTANPRLDPRRAAEGTWGYTLDWFFDQWLGPYPSVDYLLQKIVTRRVGASEWSNTITVQRVAEQPVVEPVQVLVEERDGTLHHLIWNGELGATPGAEGTAAATLDTEPAGGTHTWTLRTGSRIKSVRLDPRARLLQHAQPPHRNVDPRFNDRQPTLFRFLYTGAAFSLAASEFVNANTAAARFNAVSGFATFEGSLRRDLRVTGHGQIFRDRENIFGGGLATNLRFGRKINNQRRRARVRIAGTAAALNATSLDPRGGLRLLERVALVDDTRRFGWWPQRGRMLSAGVSARQTLRLDGEGDDDRSDVVVGATWVQLWPLAQDHVLASSVSTDIIVPLRRGLEYRGLLRAGGIGGLSGYSADEIFGRALTLVRLEYRHVYVRDLAANVAHLGYLRALGGTAFTGVGSTSSCGSYGGWFGKDSYYAHVGYALTAYMSILGVSPHLIKLDLSVPLVRRTSVQCLGHQLPEYLAEVQGLPDAGPLLPPFNINLSFGQAF